MRPGRNRKNDVPAVELAAGQQIQRRREHSDPGRNRSGMKKHSIERQSRHTLAAPRQHQQPMNHLEDEGQAKLKIRGWGSSRNRLRQPE